MWTCPHCGAPQAEAARCWVCRRSSTTCSTCRHFRASLTAELGYCGRDRRRAPLTGLELRGCWEEGLRRAAVAVDDEPVVAPTSSRRGGGPLDRPDPMRLRGFVPIEQLASRDPAADGTAGAAGGGTGAAATTAGGPGPEWPAAPSLLDATGPQDDWTGRMSLFGDAEA